MKVGLLLDDTLDTPDGVQQYVLTLGRWLEKKGHEVHYLVGASKRKDVPNLHPLAKVVRLKFNGNRVGTPLPANKKKIQKLLRKLNLDVIHVQMPYSPLFAARVINNCPNSTKIVGSFHVLPTGWLESLAVRILRLMLLKSNKRISTFIANTENTAIFFKYAWNVESVVIPNPVRIKDFSVKTDLGWDKTKKHVVFLGRLVERKGCLQFIEAVSLLPKSLRSDNVFHVGGKGPMLPKCQSLVKRLGLEDNVVFDGFIPEEIKAKYLRSADIAIFPSTGGESFGISLLEPMAAGTKVVLAGRNLGYESVMSPFPELMFRAQEPKDIAKIITRWLKADDKLIDETARKLSQHVKQFDIDTVVGPKILASYTAVR